MPGLPPSSLSERGVSAREIGEDYQCERVPLMDSGLI